MRPFWRQSQEACLQETKKRLLARLHARRQAEREWLLQLGQSPTAL
jgi:hypothetical protein